ncbi:hypothetical protein GON03_17190 [Nocardioides sp. MAH-18]|uniref:Uncharacterized protein n=1 Tax=Nocardioides agri TaxID=2682843 RepID=A0A6L6XU35_9ACTN|nr:MULTISPECIES: hypothetical protein [unclassified Nocardioides]MBA2956078.1 hypothetical protein [Nocardioides sp. CGMCC 1.13656]MVQ50924.1 hypothetical protein [Nocardioides sp. MAH-18]
MWELDDLEPAAAEMESRLLSPSGRRTPSVSATLTSVVPALLTRMSRTELGILGSMRGPVSPTVLPAGAPPDVLVSQIRVRAALVQFYRELHSGLDREQRGGVDALCDIATVLHLDRWLSPSVVAETLRPLRALVGPESELGFGPRCDEVLDVLQGVADLTGSADRVDAVADAWGGRPAEHWDGIAASLLATADVTGRHIALRMVTRITTVPSTTVRNSPVFRAIRLRAAAVILADVAEEDLVRVASEPWLAGISAGPAAY